MEYDDRIRAPLGQKPDLSHEDFDAAVLPAVLYLAAVMFCGLFVHMCGHN